LGITIGQLPTGQHNAITDIPGVQVGHHTLLYDQPRLARTGVTVVSPQPDIWEQAIFGGFFSFNGNGEMTGLPWLEESGMIGSPIGITNTHNTGVVRDALVSYAVKKGYLDGFMLPIAAETYDGWLSDIDAFHIKEEHAHAALDAMTGGPVAEGNVGGGTGMICHRFKGGIGTSSRVVNTRFGTYTVGVLVQANYGLREQLRVNGVPVGLEIPDDTALQNTTESGSIIVIIGTDAPLLPVQCKRLAKRATSGLARVGGIGGNSSGDIFLAFATGNKIPITSANTLQNVTMLPHEHISRIFEAVADATEESILNALIAAETMTGFKDRTIYALPHDKLMEIMARYQRL
jgi:D-aminopeptidase